MNPALKPAFVAQMLVIIVQAHVHKEKDIHMMARCIQLDMECATICYASAQLMSLGSEMAKAICQVCADMCWQCHEECFKHQTDHCQECARVCKICAEECQKLAA
jgi:hypothetical protein